MNAFRLATLLLLLAGANAIAATPLQQQNEALFREIQAVRHLASVESS